MTVSPTVVPNLFDAARSVNASLHVLRDKCDAAKVLGLVRCERDENLVVTLTITANLPVQLVIFPGSAEPQHMVIVETISCYPRPNLSRCAALFLASSFR